MNLSRRERWLGVASMLQTSVYWFEDQVHGHQARVPATWRLLYRDGEQWQPVVTNAAYGIAKDAYNKVTFRPVTTSGLRLEITPQHDSSAGIQEWEGR